MRITRRCFLALPTALIVQAQPQRLVESQRVTFTGIGPVRIGMTESQVRTVLSDGWNEAILRGLLLLDAQN